MRNVLDKFVEKIKRHSCFQYSFLPKTLPFMRQCGKTRQATHENMLLHRKDPICMPDK